MGHGPHLTALSGTAPITLPLPRTTGGFHYFNCGEPVHRQMNCRKPNSKGLLVNGLYDSKWDINYGPALDAVVEEELLE